VVIPSGVTSITTNTFAYCTSLTNVTLPSSVTNIGVCAFYDCTRLTGIMIPGSVTSLGDDAFANCSNLVWIYFTGNAPVADRTVFAILDDMGTQVGYGNATVYYMPGMSGWSFAFPGLQLEVWNLKLSSASFGVQNNQNRFFASGPVNVPMVVEACTNLASPVWTPLQTNSIPSGFNFIIFTDPQWTNYAARYYRVSLP
jgi:hypothetical protein